MDSDNRPDETQAASCAECGTRLAAGQDREITDDGVFCRPCFNNLTAQLQQVVAHAGNDINYSMAFVGGLLGAVTGVLVWWGFTVVTKISFGLVALVIGFAVGKGVILLSGGKHHLNLQIMAALISVAGFFYASYLVERTFIQRYYLEQGQEIALPLIPDPRFFVEVLSARFGIMDLVFLAIVVYQAWSMPAPFRMARGS